MAEVGGVMLYTKRAEQVGLLHSSTSVLYCTQILQFDAFDAEDMVRTLVAVGTLVSPHTSGNQCTHMQFYKCVTFEHVQHGMLCGV